MSKAIEPGKVQPTYSGFIIRRIEEFWEHWRNDDPVFALIQALRFADTLLLKKIKEKLKPDIASITAELLQAYRTPGVDWLARGNARNRAARKVAHRRLTPFLSKMSDLLDQWGYYELPSRRLKASDFKELEKVEG